MPRIKFTKQIDKMDCGPACVKSILGFHGFNIPITSLREELNSGSGGATINKLISFFNSIGFDSHLELLSFEELKKLKKPSILFWDKKHFVVSKKTKKASIQIMDPSMGIKNLNEEELYAHWHIESEKGLVIIINKTNQPISLINHKNGSIIKLFGKLFSFKKPLMIIVGILILSSVIQLIIPFLTQSIVDQGILYNDFSFIQLVILAQIILFIGSTIMNFLQSWIMLQIGVRINLGLSVDYVSNLLKRNITFFHSKTEGDLLERLIDNSRIETFLTTSTLSLVVAILNLLVFGTVLLNYNSKIFLVFLTASILLILWITIFLKYRRQIDNERFILSTESRNELLEIVHGIEDIKLNNISKNRKAKWLSCQINLLKIRLKLVLIGQYQRGGAITINQFKNILITLIAANSVLRGEITLGAMLAIQYVTGQLNNPIRSIISFIQNSQDAKLSYERISEIVGNETPQIDQAKSNPIKKTISEEIVISDLNFSYDNDTLVLEDVSINIPIGAKIAIVGESGSGKSTLIKILLGLIEPTKGSIKVGSQLLSNIDNEIWTRNCSTVLQDSHIFSDTIQYNITLCQDNEIDFEQLSFAIEQSSFKDVVDKLPLGLQTGIGSGGKPFSKGQSQRLFIARAIYKNGNYLFIDEASSALDKITEFKVIRNLKSIFSNKTIVSVAHKLETIKDSDLIVLLKDGKIIEQGNHFELLDKDGEYNKLYNL